MIDLSSNENPYRPSEKVIAAAVNGLNKLNRYVNRKDVDILKTKLGRCNNVSKDRIILGNGTNALLQEIIYNFSKNRSVITFNPAFWCSINAAKYNATKIVKIQLTPPKFNVDWESVINEISGKMLITLDYPNNPTGAFLIKREILIKLLENKDCLVVIDEAYYEFSKDSFVDLIDEYPNLAILRTLDKAYSLAGLRISYLIAGDIFLQRIRIDSTISQSACYAAIAAVEDKDFAYANVKMIIDERKRVSSELINLGFEVYQSHATFLLVKTSIYQFALRLRNENILISDLSNNWFSGFYRISIGTHEENNILINVIKKLMKG